MPLRASIKSSHRSIALWVISQHFYIFNPNAFSQGNSHPSLSARISGRKSYQKWPMPTPTYFMCVRTQCHASQSFIHKSCFYTECMAILRGIFSFPPSLRDLPTDRSRILCSFVEKFFLFQPLAHLPTCISLRICLWVMVESLAYYWGDMN